MVLGPGAPEQLDNMHTNKDDKKLVVWPPARKLAWHNSDDSDVETTAGGDNSVDSVGPSSVASGGAYAMQVSRVFIHSKYISLNVIGFDK